VTDGARHRILAHHACGRHSRRARESATARTRGGICACPRRVGGGDDLVSLRGGWSPPHPARAASTPRSILQTSSCVNTGRSRCRHSAACRLCRQATQARRAKRGGASEIVDECRRHPERAQLGGGPASRLCRSRGRGCISPSGKSVACVAVRHKPDERSEEARAKSSTNVDDPERAELGGGPASRLCRSRGRGCISPSRNSVGRGTREPALPVAGEGLHQPLQNEEGNCFAAGQRPAANQLQNTSVLAVFGQ
jgi:hypothetical protein